ncbi:MAG: FAD-dependent monooxygenase [Bacteroidota bacterium]
MSVSVDVVIVGGGPVGLFLAICLRKKGISCKVLEKNTEGRGGSRSVGIHPVSLQLFEKAGIVQPFLEEGIQVHNGHAFLNAKRAGTISFKLLPPPFPFILVCPQYLTEAILEEELSRLGSDILIRDAEFMEFEETAHGVETRYRLGDESNTITSRYLAGCDGKQSQVRTQAGIDFSGGSYPDTYIMADYEDNTEFGSNAAVYLADEGLVECFPLPAGKRRWVVKTEGYEKEPHQEFFSTLINHRIGHDLHTLTPTMLSSFGVQHFIAERFTKDRIVVAGDAAHIVSPVGGQGMNLGWMDGWALSNSFEHIILQGASSEDVFKAYDRTQRTIVKNATRRAHWNMTLGRKWKYPKAKKWILKSMLSPLLRSVSAQSFTMHKLDKW